MKLDAYFDRAMRTNTWPPLPVPDGIRYVEPEARAALSGWLTRRALDTREVGRMIDVGFLSGRYLDQLDPSIRTDGIDISTVAVEQIRARREGTYLHASVTDIPFPDRTYDWANCVSVLEYVEPSHQPEALAELARILKPGGILTVSFPNASDERGRRYARMERFLGVPYSLFDLEDVISLVSGPFSFIDYETIGMSHAVVARHA
ncbi:MAG: class I SAM-dependent methyltransferase [Candidatus Woesearchaeota archaeon]